MRQSRGKVVAALVSIGAVAVLAATVFLLLDSGPTDKEEPGITVETEPRPEQESATSTEPGAQDTLMPAFESPASDTTTPVPVQPPAPVPVNPVPDSDDDDADDLGDDDGDDDGADD